MERSYSFYFRKLISNSQVLFFFNIYFLFRSLDKDQDPSVLEYCEQSIELQWSKSTWIPDFVALIEEDDQYTMLILEVKYMQELLEDKEHFIQKYDETRDWIAQNFSILATSFTKLPISRIELIIVTDLVLQQSFRVRNCRKLIQVY